MGLYWGEKRWPYISEKLAKVNFVHDCLTSVCHYSLYTEVPLPWAVFTFCDVTYCVIPFSGFAGL